MGIPTPPGAPGARVFSRAGRGPIGGAFPGEIWRLAILGLPDGLWGVLISGPSVGSPLGVKTRWRGNGRRLRGDGEREGNLECGGWLGFGSLTLAGLMVVRQSTAASHSHPPFGEGGETETEECSREESQAYETETGVRLESC